MVAGLIKQASEDLKADSLVTKPQLLQLARCAQLHSSNEDQNHPLRQCMHHSWPARLPQHPEPAWLLALIATTANCQRPGGNWPEPPPTSKVYPSSEPLGMAPAVLNTMVVAFSE